MNDDTRDAIKLLERNRVGVLMRIFAHTPEAIDSQLGFARDALLQLLPLETGEKKTFTRIDFLVSSDPNFEDTDCGETAERLRALVRAEFPDAPINVFEIKRGDVYCMLLNYGIANQLEDRIAYSLILTPAVASYATQITVDRLLAAMYRRARVAGVILNEFPATRNGLILNTFALWHNKSLMTIGGFDLFSAKPALLDAHTKEKVTGWSEEKNRLHGEGDVEYHVAGCEEIIPLIRLIRFFGKCLRVVEPVGENMKRTPHDPTVDAYAYHRNFAKFATKTERQTRMAKHEDVGLEYLQTGLMEE